ncbi:glutamate racemase [Pseudomonas sp. ABC1]|uniref:glutamate racemase n=1 Tax=Pseudomonas sp. ABC1 TaxID=2748080 RepID=UPI0015C34445|nr:glutamate racemase [Pseudomonas sp. ABC1]QLF92587.1 glutamate racemase [Pseudomonas sp. ABC1]
MSESRAVGVFDSGVGGLSVLREIHARLPGQPLIYLADSAHVPYGEKTPEFIRERCRRIADFLLAQGACALVLACNTATAAAISDLRSLYPGLPLVGMEPAVKPAAQATRTGVIGVLATTGTLRSAKFAALLDQVGHDVNVIMQPCPGLVERIEAGELASPATRALLAAWVEPLLAAGCDTLILGCTHYPFIRPLLEDMLPASVSLIDTGAAVARRLEGLLAERGFLSGGSDDAPIRFWSSAAPQRMASVLPLLWGHEAEVGFFAG